MKEVDLFVQQFCDPAKLNLHIVRVKKDLFHTPEEIRDLTYVKRLQALGTRIGTIQGKKFLPSIPLLTYIAPHTTKVVTIDDTAEWLFICGRDIFLDAITSKHPKQKSLVLVKNKQNEVLGLGQYDPRDKKVAIKNILDLGSYLRSES